MITAKDLRIGNWVVVVAKHPAETMYFNGQIHTIGKDILKVGDGLTWNIEDLQPIPLTEEILLKCGFEKYTSNTKYGWYLNVGNRHLVWCWGNYVSLEFTSHHDHLSFNDTLFDLPCEHLHQLQNIFYSLTGKELKVEL